MMRHFSDFEELCMDLSECFASAKSDDIFDLISVALEKTASVMPMDEIILMMLSHDNAHVNITHSYTKLGKPIPVNDITTCCPWMTENIKNGHTLNFQDIDELPETASRIKSYLLKKKIKSAINLPLNLGDSVIGAICILSLNTGASAHVQIKRLKIIGNIISIALARKFASDELKTTTRQFRTMGDALPAAITYVDLSGRYLYANAVFHKWYGVPYGTAIGRTVREVLGDKTYNTVKKLFEGVYDGKSIRYERARTLPDGSEQQIEASLAPSFDASGHPDGFYCLIQDITERKRSEIKIQEQRNELARVTRVVSMGELTASLAHEINQPLAAILNNANAAYRYLSSKTPEINKARSALADIITDDQRAGMVLQRIRNFLSKGDFEPIDLDINNIVTEVLNLVRNDASSRFVSTELDLAQNLPMVQGDVVQLQQVLFNFVMNGFEAMQDITGKRKLLVRTSPLEDDFICVMIKDSGLGIDRSHFDSIFSPFFTTKKNGMGIGLSISQSIITAHGGRMWALPSSGQGATFCFTLPIKKEKAL